MKKHLAAAASGLITAFVTLVLLSLATLPCAVAGVLPPWARYVAVAIFCAIAAAIGYAVYQTSLDRGRDNHDQHP